MKYILILITVASLLTQCAPQEPSQQTAIDMNMGATIPLIIIAFLALIVYKIDTIKNYLDNKDIDCPLD